MVCLRLTTGMWVVLLLQTTMAVAVSLGMYKSCLYECVHCVKTWGKDLFNGELCAENCALTGGSSIDRTCTSFFTRSSRRVSAARKSAARKFLHSHDPSGRGFLHGLSTKGYSSGYQGVRGYRTRNFVPSNVRQAPVRSSLSGDCQRLCRTCETTFKIGMDAHSCLYTCVSTRRKVVAC